MKAIILAGGLGTRLRPLTDTTPKPLLPIKGKPIMQHAIENLRNHGINDIILAVSFHADKIKDYFGDGSNFGVNISYSLEEEPLGTGGAVRQAAEGIEEPFVLVWGDNLTDVHIRDLIESFERNNAMIAMTLTPREDVENFGVAKLNGEVIEYFVEKPPREEAPSNLINAGCFVIHPDALKILPDGKSNIERECFQIHAGSGKVCAHSHSGQWFPTDTIEKYNHAEENFRV
jgi:mannose-1-phosphate guanylyltransferase